MGSDKGKLSKDERIAELERQLMYAKMAIKSACTNFGIEESGVAEILSYVNGYEGSPDLRIDLTDSQ